MGSASVGSSTQESTETRGEMEVMPSIADVSQEEKASSRPSPAVAVLELIHSLDGSGGVARRGWRRVGVVDGV